jgi:hypothetical protein
MKRSSKRKARRRQRKAIKRRAILKPYLAELRHSHVPQSVIQQVEPLMSMLIGASKGRDAK